MWWFLPCIDMNQPRVYMCPHPEPPSHVPPHPIPLGCPSALALSAPFHAWNLDWSSISHMVIYMFQCYSLKSSHPRFLPQSPNFICTNIIILFNHINKYLEGGVCCVKFFSARMFLRSSLQSKKGLSLVIMPPS